MLSCFVCLFMLIYKGPERKIQFTSVGQRLNVFFFLPNDLPTEAGVHQVLFLASLYKPCDVRNGTDTSSQFLTISPSMF